jgi:hypothetical protein
MLRPNPTTLPLSVSIPVSERFPVPGVTLARDGMARDGVGGCDGEVVMVRADAIKACTWLWSTWSWST